MNIKKILTITILLIFVVGMCISAADAATHKAGTKKYNVKLTQKEYNALTKYDIKYKVETNYKTVTKYKTVTEYDTVKKYETVKKNKTEYYIDYKYAYRATFNDDYKGNYENLWYDKYGFGCKVTYYTLNCTEDNYTSEKDSHIGIPYYIAFNSSKYYDLFKVYDCPLNSSYHISSCENISKKIPYNVTVEEQVVKYVDVPKTVKVSYNVKVPYKVKIPYKVRRHVTITKTIPNKYLKLGTPVYKTRKVLETEGKYLFVGKSYTYGYQDKFQRAAMKQTLAKIKKAGYTIHWDDEYWKSKYGELYHFCYCTRKVWNTEKYWVKDINVKKYPVKVTLCSYGEFQGEYVKLGKGIVFLRVWTDYCPLTKFNVRIK